MKEFGKFDYIICHGVYSWVPNFVKDAILKTIKRLLSPNGIAYISYNVYPGWKTKDVIRDFLLFGTKNLDGEVQKAAKAKELLVFLKNYLEYYKSVKQSENFLNADILFQHISNVLQLENNEFYVFHEYLEAFNDPLYFKDFAASLDDNGLAYLTDVNLDDVFKMNLGLEGFDGYLEANFSSRIEKEQALDFCLIRSLERA